MALEMTFFEHLSELRNRFLIIVLSIISFSILGYLYSDKIINLLLKSSDSSMAEFQVLYVTSMFMIKINTAIFTGIFFSFPVILYQILIFIKPAFETSLSFIRIFLFILLSLFLFIFGIAFGYFILIPASVNFFNSVSLNLLGSINLSYTLESYLIYLLWILLISSIIYQVPILLFILVKINILDLDSLKNKRPYVMVLFFVFAALLTPPDPFSQLLVAFPMILLYEITIIIIQLFFVRK